MTFSDTCDGSTKCQATCLPGWYQESNACKPIPVCTDGQKIVDGKCIDCPIQESRIPLPSLPSCPSPTNGNMAYNWSSLNMGNYTGWSVLKEETAANQLCIQAGYESGKALSARNNNANNCLMTWEGDKGWVIEAVHGRNGNEDAYVSDGLRCFKKVCQ
jgi:hypothetical protein